MKKLLLGLSVLAAAPTVMAQDKMAELEARIGELEATQSLNIWSFSGILETSYDNIKVKQGVIDNPTPFPDDEAVDDSVNHLRLRFSLNADADISSKLKFYSRLTTTKFFNEYYRPVSGTGTLPETFESAYAAKGENGSEVYLEKAYADYSFASSQVLSFGRLPTMDGPYSHYTTGRPRSGTYPSLMYAAMLDGMAYSYNTGIGSGALSARVIYTPFAYPNSTAGKVPSAGLPGTITSPQVNGSSANTNIDLTSMMLEYSQPTSFGNFGLIYQGYQTGKLPVRGADITIVSYVLDNDPITAGNQTGFGSVTGTGAVSFEVVAHSLSAELTNIAGLPFHVGATFLQSEVKNSGSVSFSDLTSGGTNIYGLGASEEDETLKGSSTLVSLRYDVKNNFMLGAEYLAGGKNVFIYDSGHDNLSSFYSTPGTGTHAYFIYKPESQLAFKAGFTQQDYKNTPFTFGASSDTDREITTTYASLRLDF